MKNLPLLVRTGRRDVVELAKKLKRSGVRVLLVRVEGELVEVCLPPACYSGREALILLKQLAGYWGNGGLR